MGNNLIDIIDDLKIGLEKGNLNNPDIRYAARGIVRKNGKIAIFNKTNKNEYKLPGGGIEDECEVSAFEREVLE